MQSIWIGNQLLSIKDYYCSGGSGYFPRTDRKLWLYVNLTDICNGNCPFCINPGRKAGISPFDMGTFQDTLNRVREHVYGISLTGGEPMLTPYLVDDAVGAIADVFRNGEEIDLVTNGFQFDNILKLKNQASIFSIHLSKHRLSDDANDAFFGFHTVSWNELNQILSRLDDPGAIVLNCVVMKGGIDSVSQVKAYLEKASATGVRNVSFIGMNRCNSFCEEHYLDPFDLKLDEDPQIHIWSRYADYDYCHCMSGSYDGETCSIRFYLRGMGKACAAYTRQLVYTEDNRLLAGFGGKEISLS